MQLSEQEVRASVAPELTASVDQLFVGFERLKLSVSRSTVFRDIVCWLKDDRRRLL